MEAVVEFPGAAAPTFAPTVLTESVVARFAQSNHVARMLRQLGYRVVDEDVCPDDGGAPIIQVDLVGLRQRSLESLAECVTTRPDVVRAQIQGVRVFWQRVK